jgi:hypothetical protein
LGITSARTTGFLCVASVIEAVSILGNVATTTKSIRQHHQNRRLWGLYIKDELDENTYRIRVKVEFRWKEEIPCGTN